MHIIADQKLNPIQGNCPGTDPFELKREFGRDLAFTGGLDTQDMFPHGTAAEVGRATERLISAMTADGGGYILAASHTVPPGHRWRTSSPYEVAGITREEIMDRAADLRRWRRRLCSVCREWSRQFPIGLRSGGAGDGG